MTIRRLGEGGPTANEPRGVHVILDIRPLQEPDRAPTTAIYLEQLLGAFAVDELAGESFTILTQVGLPDPTESLDGLRGLPIAGRRALPPTRLLRSGALTTDPFVLRSASIGASRRSGRSGTTGSVFHSASGAVPLVSAAPIVVSLLDLAPWELPNVYQRSPAARFGHRLRARIMRDAAAVIVPTETAARDTSRLLRIRRDRLRVVPLAARAEFGPLAADAAAEQRARLGLPGRYFVYPGRFDARQDVPTLLHALADLATAARPSALAADVPWPPRLVLVDATPDDRAALARAAARYGVGELLAHAPRLGSGPLAALVAGARAAVLPAISATAGLPAVEALGAGTPVVASAVGSLPEIVGPAGLIVEPRDAARLATALASIWVDDGLHAGLVEAIGRRTGAARRTWADVARATRVVYAESAGRN